MNNESVNTSKIRVISICLLVAFFFVSALLFRWQVVDAKRFDEMATERIRNVKIPSLRGSIYAKNGATLAYEERRFDIYVYIPELERAERYNKQTRQEYIEKVASVLDQEQDDLRELLNSGPYWIKIATKLTIDKKNELVSLRRDSDEEQPLEGNFVEYTSERIYPENELACHVVGFLGDNGSGEKEGRMGIEGYWEGSLKALEGYKLEQVDSFENTIPIIDFKPIEEQRGMDINLTIDLKMQSIIETKLKESVERYRAESGAVILMDPKTGAILSLANYPNFDLNNFGDVEDPEAFSNRALTVPYEFGSIGKIFTVSGSIEEGLVTPDTVILPEGHRGCEYFRDKNEDECVRDPDLCIVCTFDKLPQPQMTVKDALVKSDNIGLYHTAELLGPTNLYKYLNSFRMGKPTGIEMYESYGYLKNVENWNIADLVTYSYGHGYQGTLLQIASGVSAVANDGKIMQPYIVESIKEPDGDIKAMKPLVIGQPISAETARIVGGMLNQVYRNNIFEHYYKNLLDYPVGMKSGTALIPYKDRPGYSDELNTTYVGFDLSSEKSFLMVAWLHKPQEGTLSSHNVRVLWLEIFEEIKDYFDIPTQ